MDKQTHHNYLRLIKTYADDYHMNQADLGDVEKLCIKDVIDLYGVYVDGIDGLDDLDKVEYSGELFRYFDIEKLIKDLYKGAMNKYYSSTNPDITEQEQLDKLHNQFTNNKKFNIHFDIFNKDGDIVDITLKNVVDKVFNYAYKKKFKAFKKKFIKEYGREKFNLLNFVWNEDGKLRKPYK